MPLESFAEIASQLKGWLLLIGLALIVGGWLLHALRSKRSEDLQTALETLPLDKISEEALQEIIKLISYTYDELALVPEEQRADLLRQRQRNRAWQVGWVGVAFLALALFAYLAESRLKALESGQDTIHGSIQEMRQEYLQLVVKLQDRLDEETRKRIQLIHQASRVSGNWRAKQAL